MMTRKQRYILDNWKLITHLLFGTYHFGVNNEWWCPSYRSMFGLPWYKRWHLINRYKEMKFRAIIGFVSEITYTELFKRR